MSPDVSSTSWWPRLLLALVLGGTPALAGSAETAADAAAEPSLPPAGAAVVPSGDSSAPPVRPSEALAPPPPLVLVPLVEVPLLDLAIHALDRYVLKAPYAMTSAESLRQNLTGPWVWDSDGAAMNFLAHPFHGSLAYNAARSSGLTFWQSLAFPAASSLLWEVAGENEPPSLNDQVMTSVSGALFGEVLHRTSTLVLDGLLPPGPLSRLVSGVLDPLGGLNRRLLGRRWDAGASLPPYDGQLLLGATALGRVQPYVGAELTVGFPGEPGAALRTPFDHYLLQLGVGAPGATALDVHVRGLVAGLPVDGDGAPRGAWGLFASHDFSTGPGFGVSSTALGPGAALQARLGGSVRLRATGVLSGVLLGAAGTQEELQSKTGGPGIPAPYTMGPGAQGLADVELEHAALGTLGVTGRGWLLAGNRGERGLERVALVRVRGTLRLTEHQRLGAELVLGHRRGDAADHPLQQGALGRLYWVVAFGHARPQWVSGPRAAAR